ncbi:MULTISPECIES: DUF421 domain-containing protein [Bacillus]|jgi:uncharacterized membrane protein YcaP (DUF421 family)|uniref:DUF421 domain-containing protein n=1 Tax=Bacillus TaxID=1386 RepID=UPI0020A1CCCC|nr:MULTISPECIES: DUF421 domain-containing protein [Bacillus]MCP1156380.1 DUF421 domain-containing protein [Bacillus infantis]MCR6608911.1 DUF421 domain-containing protein [Bacillus infantis]MDT0163489.1 DUF421 domain-containing protein [Bacillus sp. AG4(2022)]
MNIPEVLIRITVSFLVLFALARLMGRKEIAQMTFFNFVSAIAIGSIAANLVLSPNVTIRNGVIALAGWAAFTILMGYLDIKSRKARVFLEGQPLIVIKDGKVMEDSLRKARLDIDALSALLRQKNIFSISDADYAVFETDGKLSVLKKEGKRPLTQSHAAQGNPVPKDAYPVGTAVISDGQLVSQNLDGLNLSQEWIEDQLQQSGASLSDVFYAEVQQNGTLYVDYKDDQLH